MRGARSFTSSLFVIPLLVAAGCADRTEPPPAEAALASGESLAITPSSFELPTIDADAERASIPMDHAGAIAMQVYASPTCGCCSLWVERLEAEGFDIETIHRNDMLDVKRSLGVHDPLMSCHTGVVNGYVVEGHVPADDIRRLLAEAPGDVRGIAVPGMPIGSPGMEVPGGHVDRYDVLTFRADGSTEVFASYGTDG